MEQRTSTSSRTSHQEYLDSLIPPGPDEAKRIARWQDEKEAENLHRRRASEHAQLMAGQHANAASCIQRHYRGYKDRQDNKGHKLSASSRWVEAVKEARYRHMTQPHSRTQDSSRPDESALDRFDTRDSSHELSRAQRNWKKIGMIARRAANDEDPVLSVEDGQRGTYPQIIDTRPVGFRKRKIGIKRAKISVTKTMDIQYLLESTDLKHRYGTNLKVYHQQWLKSDTREAFFYWLDYGDGQFIDCAGCPRERLDREQVRYLSREERLHYLVSIDDEGRLCWSKNGSRIDTTTHFKDSIQGIVPQDDTTPAFIPAPATAELEIHNLEDDLSTSSTSVSSGGSAHHQDDIPGTSCKLDNEGVKSKPMKKVKDVSAATIFNRLLRSSVQKNTWIYVADTSFRLYVGLKQSGTFQHSSFLHGSRIASAGLLQVKDGKLEKLSPLSGHYRPPAASFRLFIEALEGAGADMTNVTISRSYKVLVGLEAYANTRKRGKRVITALVHGRDSLLTADEMQLRQQQEIEREEFAAFDQRIAELQLDHDEPEESVDHSLPPRTNVVPHPRQFESHTGGVAVTPV